MNKNTHRVQRHSRIRRKITGTKDQPRLVVFRSNKHIFAQIIDDSTSSTIVAQSDIKISSKEKLTKTERAALTGENLAKAAQSKKIKKVSFDRGGYKYSGRVKALAEGSRKGGLVF